ncbi:hypothetical protein [Pseudorhodoplanes sp.]|uniref:hypothetical protein n=1 Tax=Pseudorhodoplanes sp. TaxID=1934341 RepID=UPI003D09BA99
MDYWMLICEALRNTDASSLAERRRVYRRAKQGFKEWERSQGFDAEQIEAEWRMLVYSIRILENDIAEGVDILDENYHPQQIVDRRSAISQRHARLASKRSDDAI